MDPETWTAVEDYVTGMLIPADPALEAALQASKQAGLPAIQVAPVEGMLLLILAKAIRARTILEIGTLGGYSTLWLAEALPPDGYLVTLELDEKHAEVARGNFARAGLTVQVEVRVGPALDSLAQIAAEGGGRFDLVFIDADSANKPVYLEWALRLTHPGSLIIVDNVVRYGTVLEADSRDPKVQGVRGLIERAGKEPGISATVLQTVGSKGYDGMAIILVTRE